MQKSQKRDGAPGKAMRPELSQKETGAGADVTATLKPFKAKFVPMTGSGTVGLVGFSK